MPDGMQRVALGVEYNGASFSGFQKQAETPNTVQAYLERALSAVADEAITGVCAGRTDAGVHASEQVLHFDTLAQRPTKAWVQGVNTQLPDDIRVHWAQQVPGKFHARFSACARTYRYVLYCAPIRPALMHKSLTWTSYCLNVDIMQAAVQCLVGEHDFSSFRAAQCQAQSPVRRVEYVRFFTRGPFMVMEIKANAFLHHMVRNIVGVAVDIGRGAKPVTWMPELLGLRDRTVASPTARPWGLYLVKVDYEEGAFELPARPLGPLFLSA